MLGDSFLTVNNEQIPNPVSFDYSFEEKENIMTSESGKDMGAVVRLDKHTFSGTWHLSSTWKDKFEGYSKVAMVSLVFDGHTYDCRCRGFTARLVENSARTSGTNGLWEVSCDFIEF